MDLDQYIAYLMSNPSNSSCVNASDVLQVSHDQINRFLLASDYTGKDLFDSVRPTLSLQGGTLSVDETILDKPFTQPGTTELVGRFCGAARRSGKHHRVVQGISLLALVYTHQGRSVPVNFRVYRHVEGKSKNDYFREMTLELWQWGLRPAWVTADAWFSSLDNLKFLRSLEVGVMMGLEKNRLISTQPSEYEQVGQANIPASGLLTHLRGFEMVAVFRTVDTDSDARHYLLYHPDSQYAASHLYNAERFEQLRLSHWQVELFFRAVKQACRAEKFYVRTTSAIKTHLYCVMRAFQKLAAMSRDGLIDSVYKLREMLYRDAQRNWIHDFA